MWCGSRALPQAGLAHLITLGVASVQLVRRLREKIEPEAARPQHIHTAAGRGYRYEP